MSASIEVSSPAWEEESETASKTFPLANGKLDVSLLGEGAELWIRVPIDEAGMADIDPANEYVAFFDATFVEGEGDTSDEDSFSPHAIASLGPPPDDSAPRISTSLRPCNVAGCTQKRHKQGFCEVHFASKNQGEQLELAPEKLYKMATKKKKIVDELVETERTYQKQLQALFDLYIMPLRTNTKIISLKLSDVLFSNISSIKDMNKGLLSDLDARTDNTTIGSILGGFCPFLQMYRDYAKFHSEATVVMRKLMGQSKFRAFHDKACTDPAGNGLNLAAFLITPIQRVPRYLLLTAEIIKCTPPGDPDLGRLIAAEIMIRQAATEINQSVRESREGWLLKQGGRVKSWKRRYFVLRDGVIRYYSDEQQTTSMGSIDVKSSRVVLYNDEEERDGALFGITPAGAKRADTKRTYVVEASDEAEREKWVKSLMLHGAVDDGTLSGGLNPGCLKEGILLMHSGSLLGSSWKTRFFLLRSGQLLYFKQKPVVLQQAPMGSIELTEATEIKALEGIAGGKDGKEFGIEILENGERALLLAAGGTTGQGQWVVALKNAISSTLENLKNGLAFAESELDLEMPEPAWKEGWALKRGVTNKRWKKRYFVLDCPEMMYFKSKVAYGVSSVDPVGTVTLTLDASVQLNEGACELGVVASKEAGARMYVIKFNNNREMGDWVAAVREVVKYLAVQKLKDSVGENAAKQIVRTRTLIKAIGPPPSGERDSATSFSHSSSSSISVSQQSANRSSATPDPRAASPDPRAASPLSTAIRDLAPIAQQPLSDNAMWPPPPPPE